MPRPLPFVLLMISMSACSHRPGNISSSVENFVNTTLSFSPISASAAGLHHYRGSNFDEMLDDMSRAALDRQRKFYENFRAGLQKDFKPGELSPEDAADYGIMENQISLALLELDEVQSYLHNPTVYVELFGNAIFNPWVLEYAPKETRIRHIIARLKQAPLFLDQARTNLSLAPAIWNRVAMEENEGNIALVDRTIRQAIPANMRDEYDPVANQAVTALKKFQDFLKNGLSARDQYDWRLGRPRYEKKFRYALALDTDPETVLGRATADLQTVRGKMLELSLSLHRTMFPAHGAHNDIAGPERENRVISEVLGRIAEKHATSESYMQEARQDLAEARRFVEAKHILTLPARSNLQVIETPEFMRGLYAVGGFNPAPALEPRLGAFYWITPIPKNWPRQRAESKLKEYNFYKLKLLTVHEAIPGHYVQAEYANDVQPQSRRILRSLYGNGPYVEGWAQYATQVLLDQGFLNNSPELRLTFQKEELRVLANAILDIRLQMLNMSDQEAMDLMEKQTFQEHEEAVAKLQRAKLSSCQLPTYYTGWRGWLQVRDQYRQSNGAAYNLQQFHDRALKEGAVPLPVLSHLLAGATR